MICQTANYRWSFEFNFSQSAEEAHFYLQILIIHNFHMEYGEIQNAHSYLFCFKKSCSEMLTNTLNFFIICDHISD